MALTVTNAHGFIRKVSGANSQAWTWEVIPNTGVNEVSTGVATGASNNAAVSNALDALKPLAAALPGSIFQVSVDVVAVSGT